MEVTGMIVTFTVNGLQFQLSRDETSKKWRFSEKNVLFKPDTVDKSIEAIQAILSFIKILDSGATETDTLNAIATNFQAQAG